MDGQDKKEGTFGDGQNQGFNAPYQNKPTISNNMFKLDQRKPSMAPRFGGSEKPEVDRNTNNDGMSFTTANNPNMSFKTAAGNFATIKASKFVDVNQLEDSGEGSQDKTL